MLYSNNINKLLDLPSNTPLEESTEYVIKNNKLLNRKNPFNKDMTYKEKLDLEKELKNDKQYRENPFFISYFEKYPDETMEQAIEEYNNFLQNLNLITDNSYWKTYSKGTSDIVESKKPNTANELRTSRTSIEDKAKQRIKESVKLLEREIKDLTEMEEKRGNVPYFAESKKTIRNKIDKLKEKYPEMFKEE